MKIEMGKVYLTSNGEKVKVVCVDAPGKLPIVGVDLADGDALTFTEKGGYYDNGAPSGFDLVSEYAPPAPLLECWVNVWESGILGGNYVCAKDARWVAEQNGPHHYSHIAVHMREVRDDHA